jgi:hypothetical protein
MRKLWILMLLAISVSFSAQVRLEKPEMYIGANFGVTESMVMFNPAITQGFLMGYNGGIVFRYIAEKNVGVQVELNFSQRGWTEPFSSSIIYPFDYLPQTNRIALPNKKIGYIININPKTYTSSYSRQLNYIELPFMTHIYIGRKNRVFFNVGPKISYLISEKTLVDESGNSKDVQHITPVQHPFDYGLCTGLGILFNIKGKILQLDTRANYSLSDVFNDQKKDYFANSNNLNASVNLAWLFQVK